jgi:hypothetical protein
VHFIQAFIPNINWQLSSLTWFFPRKMQEAWSLFDRKMIGAGERHHLPWMDCAFTLDNIITREKAFVGP